MLPIVVLAAALQCDVAAVQAKTAEATELMARVREEDAEVQDHRARIAQIQQAIATERRNPAGVVDLRLLHDLGADLQTERHWLASSQADLARDTAALKRLIAQAETMAKVCKR